MRRSDAEGIEDAIEADPQEAVALCEALLDDHAGDADVWAYLAEAHWAAGDRAASLEALAEVVELDPNWIEAYTMRAELHAEDGDLAKAEIELEVAGDLDGEDPRVQRAMAFCLEVRGDFQAADRLYRAAADGDPLWPAPPRLARGQLTRTLARHLGLAGDAIVVREMPADGVRSRMVERAGDDKLVVYARNVERELDEGAGLDDFAMLVEDAVADAG